MKTAVIFIGLLVAFVIAEKEQMCPLGLAMQRGVEECKESMKPSAETMELMMNGGGSGNKDLQCFQACVMEKAGVKNGASIDVEKMESLMRSAEHPDETKIEAVVGLAKACKAEAEVSDDECEVMGNFLQCLAKKVEAAKPDQ